MTVEFFKFDEQSEKNKILISQILYKAFEMKFKPLFKKVSLDQSIEIIKRCLSKTSGLLGKKANKIIGVAILSTIERPSLTINKDLKKKIGLISYFYFKEIFYSEKFTDTTTIKIELLAINKGVRGKGFGSIMLSEIIKYSRQNKFKRILLDVVDTNPRAKMLYTRIGFKTIKKHYSGIFTKPFDFKSFDVMSLNINKKYKSIPI